MISALIKDDALSEKLFVLFVCLFLVYHIVAWRRDTLRDVPGPFIARFTRLWFFYKMWRTDFHQTNINLHKKYGSIVRIAPGQYSMDDAESAKKIYAIHGSVFKKSPFYWAFTYPTTFESQNIFSTQDEHQHAEQRRWVASAYSLSSVLEYEPHVNKTSEAFFAALTRFAESGKPLNLGSWFQYFAYDVIGRITFSRDFGLLDVGQDVHGTLGAIDSANQYRARMGVYPEFHSFLSKIANYFPNPLNSLSAFVVSQVRNAVQRHSDDSTTSAVEPQPHDFITKVLAAHSANPGRIPRCAAVMMAARGNVSAGSDTTGVSLSAVLYHLIRSPRAFAILRAELDAADISTPVPYVRATQLPYLQAVIREGLRLHPAIGTLLPRVVPSGGAALGGHWFPEGSVVGMNGWVAHRNKAVFGTDAEDFRPERWIDCSHEQRKLMDQYSLGFGAGSRVCMGRWISLLEMNKLVPALVAEWDWELVNKEREWTLHNVFFVKPQDFEVKVERRVRAGQ